VNVYATYHPWKTETTSLRILYRDVNEQAENLTQLPDSKIQVMGNLFTALPSDDSTNPKELIRELIREGKMVFCFRRILPKQILKLGRLGVPLPISFFNLPYADTKTLLYQSMKALPSLMG